MEFEEQAGRFYLRRIGSSGESEIDPEYQLGDLIKRLQYKRINAKFAVQIVKIGEDMFHIEPMAKTWIVETPEPADLIN